MAATPLTDPSTGAPLPPDAIQRIIFINPKVHVYQIPPMSSLAGHKAADWTVDPARLIFTSRLRILETDPGGSGPEDHNTSLSSCLVLEDPSTGQLFAAAPYDSPSVVEPATDSSRFFAIRVRDPSGGKKALLGIGFEERTDAFDFSVALEEARRVLGMETGTDQGRKKQKQEEEAARKEEFKRDLSLKEGETITVNLGGKFGARKRGPSAAAEQTSKPLEGASLNAFALAPPPGAGGGSGSGASFLPPPPKTTPDARAQKRLSRGADKESAKALGFDDGQFGEFA